MVPECSEVVFCGMLSVDALGGAAVYSKSGFHAACVSVVGSTVCTDSKRLAASMTAARLANGNSRLRRSLAVAISAS